jgi:hypothetical protein
MSASKPPNYRIGEWTEDRNSRAYRKGPSGDVIYLDRVIMEDVRRRPLTENETVEYIDENPRNLDVKNLGVVSIPQPPSPSKQSRASSA